MRLIWLLPSSIFWLMAIFMTHSLLSGFKEERIEAWVMFGLIWFGAIVTLILTFIQRAENYIWGTNLKKKDIQ